MQAPLLPIFLSLAFILAKSFFIKKSFSPCNKIRNLNTYLPRRHLFMYKDKIIISSHLRHPYSFTKCINSFNFDIFLLIILGVKLHVIPIDLVICIKTYWKNCKVILMQFLFFLLT